MGRRPRLPHRRLRRSSGGATRKSPGRRRKSEGRRSGTRHRGSTLRAAVRASAFLVVAAAAACGGAAETVLHVRSELPVELGEALEEGFEAEHPEVDLRITTGDADAGLEPLRTGSGALDVWLGAPAVALERAAAEGLLELHAPSWATVDEPRLWHPLMASPLVVAFDRTVVPLTEAPLDWIDVLHYAWFGEVGALDPASSPEGALFLGAMIVESLRDDDDLNRGFDWLARFHDQVALYAPESETLLRRVAAGDLLLAVVPRGSAESARAGSPTLHYRVPTSGTPEALRGVAIVAGAVSPEAARAFVDHLGSAEVATAIKRHTHWEPLVGTVDESALPDDFELEQRWAALAPAVDTLAAELDGWVERWELEIRPR